METMRLFAGGSSADASEGRQHRNIPPATQMAPTWGRGWPTSATNWAELGRISGLVSTRILGCVRPNLALREARANFDRIWSSRANLSRANSAPIWVRFRGLRRHVGVARQGKSYNMSIQAPEGDDVGIVPEKPGLAKVE